MKSVPIYLLLTAVTMSAGMARAANIISAYPDHRFDMNTVPPPGLQGYVFYATGATPGHDGSSSSAIGISSGTLSSPSTMSPSTRPATTSSAAPTRATPK